MDVIRRSIQLCFNIKITDLCPLIDGPLFHGTSAFVVAFLPKMLYYVLLLFLSLEDVGE